MNSILIKSIFWIFLIASLTGCNILDEREPVKDDVGHCNDGELGRSETDIDCGGTCKACAPGKECLRSKDCISKICTNNECVTPACNDGIQNQNEKGIDCEGPCESSCKHSSSEEFCNLDEGITCPAGMYCVQKKCLDTIPQNHCENGTFDTDHGETDIDCGGDCELCESGQSCITDTDCKTGNCDDRRCKVREDWWDPTWKKRVKLTFNSDVALINFVGFIPVPFKEDVIVGERPDPHVSLIQDNKKLPFRWELEVFDGVIKGGAWVKFPTIAVGANTFYVYFDKQMSKNEYFNLWKPKFLFVLHYYSLNAATRGGTRNIGMSHSQGRFAKGMKFATDGYAQSAAYLRPLDILTVSSWIKLRTSQEGQKTLISAERAADFQFYIEDDRLRMCFHSSECLDASIANRLTLDTWHYIVGVTTPEKSAIYFDGEELINRPVLRHGPIELERVIVGSTLPSRGTFEGEIDEVRIADRTATKKEIHFEYEMLNKADFFTIGSIEQNDGL